MEPFRAYCPSVRAFGQYYKSYGFLYSDRLCLIAVQFGSFQFQSQFRLNVHKIAAIISCNWIENLLSSYIGALFSFSSSPSFRHFFQYIGGKGTRRAYGMHITITNKQNAALVANEAARKTIKMKIMVMIWRKYKGRKAHNFAMFECGCICMCAFLCLCAIKDNLRVEMNRRWAKHQQWNNEEEKESVKMLYTTTSRHTSTQTHTHICTNLLTWPEVFYSGIYSLHRVPLWLKRESSWSWLCIRRKCFQLLARSLCSFHSIIINLTARFAFVLCIFVHYLTHCIVTK